MEKYGFEPIYDTNSKILVLGSFPSVKSRAEGFYYGNKQNRFWKTIAKAVGKPVPDTIPDKISILLTHNIALWDIVESCEIEGSMDSHIKNPKFADILKIVNQTSIKTIICNGKTSFSLLVTHIPSLASITICLPSTSPANIRFNEQIWIKNFTNPTI